MSKLSTWARGQSGKTEFSSQGALASYLREHPKADRSKHTVAASPAASPAATPATTAAPALHPDTHSWMQSKSASSGKPVYADPSKTQRWPDGTDRPRLSYKKPQGEHFVSEGGAPPVRQGAPPSGEQVPADHLKKMGPNKRARMAREREESLHEGGSTMGHRERQEIQSEIAHLRDTSRPARFDYIKGRVVG